MAANSGGVTPEVFNALIGRTVRASLRYPVDAVHAVTWSDSKENVEMVIEEVRERYWSIMSSSQRTEYTLAVLLYARPEAGTLHALRNLLNEDAREILATINALPEDRLRIRTGWSIDALAGFRAQLRSLGAQD